MRSERRNKQSGWHVALCDLKLTIYNLFTGVLAQLVERLNGIEEVTGSNPVGSIFLHIAAAFPAAILRSNNRVTFPERHPVRTAAILRV